MRHPGLTAPPPGLILIHPVGEVAPLFATARVDDSPGRGEAEGSTHVSGG